MPTPPPVHIAFLDEPPPAIPGPLAPAAPLSPAPDSDDDDDDEHPQALQRNSSTTNNHASHEVGESSVRRVVDEKPVSDTAPAGAGQHGTAYVREVYSSRTAPPASVCATCNTRLSSTLLARLRDVSRFCYYTGKWYCRECHANARAVVPARAVLHWDLRPFPVSLAAQSLLAEGATRPLLNVASLNEALYRTAPELGLVKEVRERLVQLGDYVQTCAERATLMAALGPRSYLLESVHLYSLRDLIEVHSGTFLPRVQAWAKELAAHVVACAHCRGKGFICERCENRRVIFPFQPNTLRCLQCRALYHAACFSADFQCVKCVRIRQIRGKLRAGTLINSPTTNKTP